MKLIRFPEVKELTGLSRSTVWRLEKEGLFPARRRISKRLVGWRQEEVNEWVRERPLGSIEKL